ncbi:MAG: hypothetical protein Kow0077_11580 [Anaerolineae bacterium]
MSRAFKKLFGFGPWRKGPELVAVIRLQGIEVYNHARSRNPGWRPDFSGASLAGLDLSRANVKGAIMITADLNGVIIDNLEMTDERARPRLKKRGAIVS